MAGNVVVGEDRSAFLHADAAVVVFSRAESVNTMLGRRSDKHGKDAK